MVDGDFYCEDKNDNIEKCRGWITLEYFYEILDDVGGMSKSAVPILKGRPCAYIGLQIGNLGKGMLRSFINVVLAPAFSELCTAFKSFTMKRKRKNLIEALFVLKNWDIDARFFFFFFCMDGTQNTLRKEKLVVGEVTVAEIVWEIGILVSSPMMISSFPLYSEWVPKLLGQRWCGVLPWIWSTNCGNSTRYLEWCN